MRKVLIKTEQKGTLMVEALAMLGLIAMVTPTLYKKSAERLQEIQDINAASQARTMSNSMTAFINANYAALLSEMRDYSTNTLEVVYDDSSHAQKTFSIGYSSFLPYGYKPDDIRGFGEPKVFIHKDNTYVTSYVIYPKKIDIGEKRFARLASLVGANGGLVDKKNNEFVAQGTGGAWYLDKDQLEDLLKAGNSSNSDILSNNSLIVTSEEPVSLSYDDNAKFLYRVPPENPESSEYYHNTMITDLYMGGYSEETDWAANANDYYSIFNVRKLTMNTDCRRSDLTSSTTGTDLCQANVADLYIGKPFIVHGRSGGSSGTYGTGKEYGSFGDASRMQVEANEGAAWIYGNLAALNAHFRLTHESSASESSGYDVMRFVRKSANPQDNNWDDDDDELVVFEARNDDDTEAGVGFMDRFVQVRQKNATEGAASSNAVFMVGRLNEEGEDGAMMRVYREGNENRVEINNLNSLGSSGLTVANTYINNNGGFVYINNNGGDSSIPAETYINEGGGKLSMGQSGGWLTAGNTNESAVVHILQAASSATDRQLFTVGTTEEDEDHMIYANRDKVSMRGGKLRVYADNYQYADDVSSGGIDHYSSGTFSSDEAISELKGLTTVASRDFDVLGRTYMGSQAMKLSDSSDGIYSRANYTLGVAGSAWVDDFLWARDAWFKQSGFHELHAGFSSITAYRSNPQKGWFNAYDDKVVIRSPTHVSDNGSGDYDAIDSRLYADSTKVRIGDGSSFAHFENNTAELRSGGDMVFVGNTPRYAHSTSTEGSGINMLKLQGSQYVELATYAGESSMIVDVQHGAMRFMGHALENENDTTSNFDNIIAAKARYFTIQTGETNSSSVDDGQFIVGDEKVRVRYSDFMVEKMDDDSSKVRFAVRPNVGGISADEESTSNEATVMVDGSLHITGNNIVHVAANTTQRADDGDSDNPHAMFEIDPEYIQVWAKVDNSLNSDYAGPGSTTSENYYAMLKINPYDVGGETSSNYSEADSSSIYIRKGAIELERSTGSSYAADQGYGYIMANRFVSNVGEAIEDNNAQSELSGDHIRGTQYDMFMVNPAYTSVMHDIKLTTRGGARLSDILPDFVLKGVYNVSNDYVEGASPGSNTDPSKGRIRTSAGTEWCSHHSCVAADVAWASPFIGRIPFAQCPPGYQNMATMMPISFQVGQAGEMIKASGVLDNSKHGTYVINSQPRQGMILPRDGDVDLLYPGFYRVEDVQLQGIYEGEVGSTSIVGGNTVTVTRGWFMGIPKQAPDDAAADYEDVFLDDGTASDKALDPNGMNRYTYKLGANSYRIAQPLYFQQNTWLKTSLKPQTKAGQYELNIKGWDAFMGFVYDANAYGAGISNEGYTDKVYSNNTDGSGNDEGSPEVKATLPGSPSYVWNLFPVPTNSLEGHATVYCYFDRKQFENWGGGTYVDQVDQLNNYHDVSDRQNSSKDYYERLNDPSLKYTDPW